MSLEWYDEKFKARVGAIVANNMYRACNFVADQARARAPRLTGKLVRGIDIAVDVGAKGNVIEGRVGVVKKVFWAWFQEMGTSKLAARPFVRPAGVGTAERIVRMIEGKE